MGSTIFFKLKKCKKKLIFRIHNYYLKNKSYEQTINYFIISI